MNIDDIKFRYNIIGNCSPLNTAIEIALQAAQTNVSILVLGENGTGKDIFSRLIHENSKRKHRPYIAINCGAIPEGTMDSELFGHVKGSFTSAHADRKGYFETVNSGTIFLDEIGEMPMETQAKLLRLLETGEFIRVGSSKVQTTDVRVIGATNKNLLKLIQKNRFREDLFYRLNTVSIYLPPLRERGEDIEMLFKYFAYEFAEKYGRDVIRLEKDAIDILMKYRWPGNVRELKNFVEKLSILANDNTISAEEVKMHLNFTDNLIPAIYNTETTQFTETSDDKSEIIYKLFLDLKKEVDDLKKFIYLNFSDTSSKPNLNMRALANYYEEDEEEHEEHSEEKTNSPQTIEIEEIMNSDDANEEESLSIADKEKELIIKALKIYKNNKKLAAEKLGISERTLYRKLKTYEIQ